MSVSSFPQGTIAASAAGFLVTVSGELIQQGPEPVPVTAGVRFNSDGTVDGNFDGSYSQIDSGTDWIIPNGAASGDFKVKATQTGSSGAATRTGTLATGLALSSSHEWKITKSSGTGLATWTLLIEISDDDFATVLDSATYTLEVEKI